MVESGQVFENLRRIVDYLTRIFGNIDDSISFAADLFLTRQPLINMNEYNPDPAAKKVRYIASIIYLLVLAFIVGGSYIHQQKEETLVDINVLDDEEIIWKELNGNIHNVR